MNDDLPRPEPAAGQLLVHIKAAGVGNWDALVREGKMPKQTLASHSRLRAVRDYRIEGSDAEAHELCVELKEEQVRFIVVRTETPDGKAHAVLRLVPVPLQIEGRLQPSRSAFSTGS